MARMVSVRPEPTSPATPSSSPWRTPKETAAGLPLKASSSTRKSSAPGVTAASNGYSAPISLPTIMRTICGTVTSVMACVATFFPFRNTVMRSPISKVSCRRWEM